MMQFTAPITIYYDKSCPLCAAEIHSLHEHAKPGSMILIDCSTPDFNDPLAVAVGISQAQMMERITARDAQGRWFSAADVFSIAYGLAGARGISAMLQRPFWRRLFDWAYPVIVRNRQLLSRLGLQHVFTPLVRSQLKQPQGTSTPCNAGQCQQSKH